MKKIGNINTEASFFYSIQKKRFNSVRKFSSSKKMVLNSTFRVGDLIRPMVEKSGIILQWSGLATVGAFIFGMFAKIFEPIQWFFNSLSSFADELTKEN